MPRLSARKVESAKKPGMYSDGEGLYLRIGPTGAKSWVLRTVVHGRRRDIGLGSAKLVTLAEAREEARRLRKIARSGGDPLAQRQREALTFQEATKRVHESLRPTWRSDAHAQRWLASVERYVYPRLANRPIETIGTADVLAVLEPIWTSKHDTAKRVRQRLNRIFDWAKGAGHYQAENPVNGVDKALPTVKAVPKHMESLPWAELPQFLEKLRDREEISALALEFLILTAARSSEVRLATWDEIHGDVWVVPADRAKSKRDHRVPLSPQAQAVLERVSGLHRHFIFSSPMKNKAGVYGAMSDTVFAALYKRMNVKGITTHGFRSTFRDWVGDNGIAPREVAEAALAHATGDKVERAYARSDLFERRKELMNEWGRYCA